MDEAAMAAMAAARERQGMAGEEEQRGEEQVVEEEEEYQDMAASPVHPGRSRFDMSNIVEESRLEESRLEVSATVQEEEEEEALLQPLLEEASPALRRSLQPMVGLQSPTESHLQCTSPGTH